MPFHIAEYRLLPVLSVRLKFKPGDTVLVVKSSSVYSEVSRGVAVKINGVTNSGLTAGSQSWPNSSPYLCRLRRVDESHM